MTTLPTFDGNNAQFIFDRIASSLIDTGGRQIKLRWGTTSYTWTAQITGPFVTVSHGMGSTPVGVLLIPSVPGGAVEAQWRVVTLGATQFQFDGTRNSSTTATTGIFWIALG